MRMSEARRAHRPPQTFVLLSLSSVLQPILRPYAAEAEAQRDTMGLHALSLIVLLDFVAEDHSCGSVTLSSCSTWQDQCTFCASVKILYALVLVVVIACLLRAILCTGAIGKSASAQVSSLGSSVANAAKVATSTLSSSASPDLELQVIAEADAVKITSFETSTGRTRQASSEASPRTASPGRYDAAAAADWIEKRARIASAADKDFDVIMHDGAEVEFHDQSPIVKCVLDARMAEMYGLGEGCTLVSIDGKPLDWRTWRARLEKHLARQEHVMLTFRPRDDSVQKAMARSASASASARARRGRAGSRDSDPSYERQQGPASSTRRRGAGRPVGSFAKQQQSLAAANHGATWSLSGWAWSWWGHR